MKIFSDDMTAPLDLPISLGAQLIGAFRQQFERQD
jgi:hypothetical protein